VDASHIRDLLEKGQNSGAAFAPEKTAEPALAETLAALANANGGTLLLGVTRAGSVRGTRNAQASCEQVLSAALLTVPPLILPMPEQVQVRDRMVVVAQVPPGLPNVYAVDGHYWIRDGPRNRPLELAQVHELMMQRGVIHLETQVPDGAAASDLDWDRVRQYVNRLEQMQQLEPSEILRRRGCLAEQDGDLCPTYAGLLLFGPTPSQWIANASITAVRYGGRQMSDQFIREDIGGPLPDQIRKAEAFLRANAVQEVVLGGLNRQERPTYPTDVLREVIVNAVAHRDYTVQGENIQIFVFSDRVRIYNPGRLAGHVTLENMIKERFSRNPVIVQVLADLGFIESLGYGIDRMLRLLQEGGYPAPRFEETAAGFEVTIHARPTAHRAAASRRARLDLNPRQELALQYVIAQQRITNREYQTLCPEVSAETIRRDLSDLVHKDVLLRIGRKRATYYILKDASLATG
jgi:ATP-dependent DNA helicase RecG